MKLWHILALVALGVAYGFIAPGQFQYALGHATLYIFLPPLLFEAAWNLNYRAIARQWRPIVALAGPGVVVTALIIAGALSLVHVPFATGFLVGAILSATDPIAVVAIFRRLRVPRTLATIVECESLFNDATAVVLYGGIIATYYYASGTRHTSIPLVTAIALAGILGGCAIGIACAFLMGSLLRKNRQSGVQIMTTVCGAFGTYFVADGLSMSGIFAAISFGIALRYFERRWISLQIAEDVSRFWDIAAILCNAIIFFMVGAALPLDNLIRYPVFVIATIAGVAGSRYLVPMLLCSAKFPRHWLNVIRAAGLRSALSLALALALPPATPYRAAIIDATFAVALVTLAVGGPLVSHFATLTVRRRAT